MRVAAFFLAAGFAIVGFYPSLAALSPTPTVGDVIVSAPVAAAALAFLVAGACVLAPSAWAARGESETFATLAVWIGAVTLSSLFGFDPLSGLSMVALMSILAIYHLGLLRWYASGAVARAVITVFLAAGTIAALTAVAMQALQVPPALYSLNNGRAAGLFVTANQLAAFLLTFTTTAFGVATATRHRSLRLLGWTAVGAGLVAMVDSFSRSGWIALAIAAAFLAAQRGGRRLLPLVGVGALAAVAFLVVKPDTHHNRGENLARVGVWDAGSRIAARFPLAGVGPMAYWRVYPDLRPPGSAPPGSFEALHPHDVYLSVAAEMGIVGVVALGWGWWRFSRAFLAARAAASPAARRFATAVAAGILATFVQGVVDTIGIVEMTFVWIPFMSLALCAARHGLAEGEA